ncbi:hypothetical protein E9232_004232 [Inquilinus ginsengisoli]|uniref:DNA helicase n=1 Tax=Inquilinus ginsengisoli TaxID=363840 RepID=A0ABU1JTS3_9PROT|nr:DUF3320 domain-containing protein [Inquilinus ginsengisoli]MDR6291698.1 hypothetical protein [Inquilinus ginsengisoli]
MTFEITAVVAGKVGFASHQNAVPVLRELEIASTAESAMNDLELTLTADPPFLAPKTWRIDRLAPDGPLHVADRDVALNAGFLGELTESIRGTVTLRLAAAGQVLAESAHPIELLARSEWGGAGTMAELLPVFVMPNDPAVDRVLKAASDVLRRAGRPSGLDGYGAGSRERVWELASAIWSAIAGFRIAYALPPASFEQQGQKVRTPGAILDGQVATCLDTALLFAAALEQAGLNPLIIMTRGHAFAGLWLQPVEFSALIIDEAAALRRRIDLKDLLVFETTLATQAPPPSFSQAERTALRQIAEDAVAPFELAVDIRRARMQKIRPLSLAGTAPAGAPAEAVPVAEALEAAPVLPGFDVEVAEAPTTAAGRIALWQRKLLNLTTSNRLLNLPEGGKVVRLQCPEPGSLEDRLAAGGKVRIVAMPDLAAGGRDEKLFEAQTNENLRDQYAQAAMERGEVLSLLDKQTLDTTLVDLYRKARSDMAEGGANTLFLALGFLKWKKAATDPRSFRAPLILLPVRLERKSALSGVIMTQHEDEPRFNLTLLELLRQDFEFTIPALDGPLPTDERGVDVAGIWTTVRRAVRDLPGFEVTEELVLGTFSFAKYLMWKDLVDRADRLKQSPTVRHLIERDGTSFPVRGEFPRPDRLDQSVDPADLFVPLPADSSQIAAVVASGQGHDFVLDGPPGTGKSQTIANMIAHNLALGRRVLFVAEKMAALNVVQRRLAERGLGEFCLELHSAKATKTEVLKQLDRAWTTRETMNAEEWAREGAEVKRLRDGLNDLVALLHRRAANGLTIRDAIGRVVRDWTETSPRFAFAPGRDHGEADLARLRDIARRLGLARTDADGLSGALDGIGHADWSNGWQEAIVAAARALPPALDAMQAARDEVLAATRLPLAAEDPAQLARLRRDLRLAFAPDAADRIAAARQAIGLVERYRRDEAALSARYAPEAARRIGLAAIRAAWQGAEAKIWPLAGLARKRVGRDLAQQGGAAGPVDVPADLPHLDAMAAALAELDGLAPRLAGVPGWAGLASDGAAVESALALAEALRAAISAAATGPEHLAALRGAMTTLVVDANDLLADGGAIARAQARLGEAAASYDAAVQRFDELAEPPVPAGDFAAVRGHAGMVAGHAPRLKAWTDWRRVRDEAMQSELGPLVTALETGAIAPRETSDAFETGYARWFASGRIDAEPLLSRFAASVHMDNIESFRRLDGRLSELAVRYIRARICGLIPAKDSVGRGDGYAVLKHQLQLQRRHKPIRQLAAEMGESFTRLAPCMLMSPLSIAQYLPPDQALFDLVIFDEASQISPWDAVGAIARGAQVVIAGDPRQMPPTSFFTRSATATDSDADLEEDMESILDECLAAGVPMHSLSWHYRSRHESLIAFSNHRYYESGLVTFPAPVTRASAVEWRRVDGVYARGKGRTNPIEAQALVDEAVRRLTDPAFVAAGRTLGIITLNADQQRLVEDLLDKARRQHPEIEPHFGEDRTEPVVVKNLETVQGDERDLIMLGIGFGPTEPGARTMSMSFGALNSEGGWRRLNVAVTRARQEMMVFTSFDPGMIDLNRTSARAVRDLKHFIEFAERGPAALAEAVHGSVGGPESPFEVAVARELARRGWTVVPQIGVSRFRIDLGIVHPDRPGDYLAGVECDGAAYHSAATARDRDKVRAGILEGLGWTLMRIWSTDWWIDKAGSADRLHRALEAALDASRAEAAVAAAAATPTPPEPILVAPPPEADIVPTVELPPASATANGAAAHVPDEAPARLARQVPADGIAPAPAPYRVTDFTPHQAAIDPVAFYEPAYDSTLAALVGHVLDGEAPISESLLVQRIARAHGFQRAGRLIRERVMGIVAQRHHTAPDGTAGLFVWPDREVPARWQGWRTPATPDDIRQIEEIALAEIRAAAPGQGTEDAAVEIARLFGIRRLTAPARQRIEAALAAGPDEAQAQAQPGGSPFSKQ